MHGNSIMIDPLVQCDDECTVQFILELGTHEAFSVQRQMHHLLLHQPFKAQW
jgi:hypothetical protein